MWDFFAVGIALGVIAYGVNESISVTEERWSLPRTVMIFALFWPILLVALLIGPGVWLYRWYRRPIGARASVWREAARAINDRRRLK